MQIPILSRLYERDVNKIKSNNIMYIKNETKATELARKILDVEHEKENELGRRLTNDECKEIENSILNKNNKMNSTLKDIELNINTMIGSSFAFENYNKTRYIETIIPYINKYNHKQIKHIKNSYICKTYNEYYNIRIYRRFIVDFKVLKIHEISYYLETDERIQEALQFFTSIEEIVDPFYFQWLGRNLIGNYYNIYLTPYRYKKYENIILYMKYKVPIFSDIFHVHEHHKIIKKEVLT